MAKIHAGTGNLPVLNRLMTKAASDSKKASGRDEPVVTISEEAMKKHLLGRLVAGIAHGDENSGPR